MTCLDSSELARAATTGERPLHLDGCLDCTRKLEHQRAIRDALRALPVPTLTSARRRAIKAETMAVAARPDGAPRWPWAVALIATAATVLAIAGSRRAGGGAASVPPLPSERIALGDRRVAHEDVPPPLRAPTLDAGRGAVVSHTEGEQRDVFALADGTVDVDTRGARDADVTIGRTVVRVDDARVRIRAHDHAVVSVEVIIGSARVVGPDQRVTLERDSLWIAHPPAAAVTLSAFRDGWLALRAGRDREAITLFDRATDPAVAEEASYWAAVAALRAGDDADAKQRFTDFLARFPSSPYAAKARAALR